MKIFVARLSQSTTSESLQMLLEQWGEVTSSKVIMDPQTGRSKCYGFVEMSDDEKAAQAIAELEGVEYEGSVITLKESVPHEEYKKTHPSTPAPQKQFRPRQVNYRPAQRKERSERPYNPQGEGQYTRREGGYVPRQNGGEYNQRPNNGGYRPRQNNGGYRQQQNNGGYRPRQNNNGGYQQRPYQVRENAPQRPYRRYDNENTTPSEE
ncbi:MAG: hypothetical protein IIY15_04620 [Flavobacteriales bacterium]|jgi:RNA recognition motif-containing protein|nr:hypothetical protein [Flavobacteriales bacterium]